MAFWGSIDNLGSGNLAQMFLANAMLSLNANDVSKYDLTLFVFCEKISVGALLPPATIQLQAAGSFNTPWSTCLAYTDTTKLIESFNSCQG